jgi:hypothetical protein
MLLSIRGILCQIYERVVPVRTFLIEIFKMQPQAEELQSIIPSCTFQSYTRIRKSNKFLPFHLPCIIARIVQDS